MNQPLLAFGHGNKAIGTEEIAVGVFVEGGEEKGERARNRVLSCQAARPCNRHLGTEKAATLALKGLREHHFFLFYVPDKCNFCKRED